MKNVSLSFLASISVIIGLPSLAHAAIDVSSYLNVLDDGTHWYVTLPAGSPIPAGGGGAYGSCFIHPSNFAAVISGASTWNDFSAASGCVGNWGGTSGSYDANNDGLLDADFGTFDILAGLNSWSGFNAFKTGAEEVVYFYLSNSYSSSAPVQSWFHTTFRYGDTIDTPASYSLPMDPSDFSTTTSLFDHDSVSSQMTRYDGIVFYGNDADIGPGHCVDAQGCYDGHHGIDFGTNIEGKNVLAAASGTVAFLDWQNPLNRNEGYGYYMRIYHPEFNQSTIYAHATTTASFFSINDAVSKGDTILLSGMTGGATGPHLHFGVTIGDTVDPNETIDPFGWTGTSTDPRTNDRGYLWRTNPPSL